MNNYGETKHGYKNKTKCFPTYRFSPITRLDPVNQCQVIRLINIIVQPIFHHGLFHLNYD